MAAMTVCLAPVRHLSNFAAPAACHKIWEKNENFTIL
jgi:hypothetical protein